jgi:hypothetical protein
MTEKTLAVQRIASIVLAVIIIACAYIWYQYPGHPGNPHEWLNDTMKRTAKVGTTATVDVGQWKNQLHEPAVGEGGRGIYWDSETSVTGELSWTALFDISRANYTFMKIRTPDNRCFVVDICLKHGETKLTKCNP